MKPHHRQQRQQQLQQGKVSSFAFEDKYGLNHNQEIGNGGGGGGSPIISIKNYLSSTSISSFSINLPIFG